MERTKETLEARVRETPLTDRLIECRKRIGNMCSDGRAPRMCIPVQDDDDDFFICTTLADAQATVEALQARVRELEESRDAWRASQECSEKAYMALVNQIPAERFDYDPVNVALLDGAKEQEIIGRKQIADLQAALDAEREKVKGLEVRLEIDHAYNLAGEKVPCPPNMPDGIECRNETIRLQDKHIHDLQSQLAQRGEEADKQTRLAIDLLTSHSCQKHQEAAKQMGFKEYYEQQKSQGCDECAYEALSQLQAVVRALPVVETELSDKHRAIHISASISINSEVHGLVDPLKALLDYRRTLDATTPTKGGDGE